MEMSVTMMEHQNSLHNSRWKQATFVTENGYHYHTHTWFSKQNKKIPDRSWEGIGSHVLAQSQDMTSF